MIGLFVRVLFAILLVASFSDAADKAKMIAKDGQYFSYDNGIVYDEKTNLEWIVGPDNDTSWDEAKEWVESLKVAGGGWRMPTREEIESLYKYGSGKLNMPPLFKTTGWWVWSREIEGLPPAKWGFYFYYDNEAFYNPDKPIYTRGFAVRSRR
jgi:hypothetical protein